MNVLSVITINYNNKPGLADTFASVFCQTFSNFEYIVIDGGSTDGSNELIERHAAKISRWVSEKDKGIYDAMNKGIAAASGEYLIFLNSGDCFNEANTLEQCMQYLSEFPAADILYADVYYVNGTSVKPEVYKHPSTLTLKYLKKQIPNQQASLIKSALFKEIGIFPQQYWLAADYWFYLKSFLAGKTITYMNFIMVRYNTTGLSATNVEICLAEMDEIWENLVPVHMRRRIDKLEEFKKTRPGRIVLRLFSICRAIFT